MNLSDLLRPIQRAKAANAALCEATDPRNPIPRDFGRIEDEYFAARSALRDAASAKLGLPIEAVLRELM